MFPRTPRRQTGRDAAPHLDSGPLVAGVLASMILAGCSHQISGPSVRKQPVVQGAPFTWSMPARYHGLVDYPDSAQIHPASWTVNLDACNITGDSYTWYVDGDSVASVGTCKYSQQFPAEGSYDVAVNVTSATDTTVHSEEKVVVQDWLILSIGDSYASGEGNPDVPMRSDVLVAQIEASVIKLQAAQQQLQAAKKSLQAALGTEGLAQTALNSAVQLQKEFQSACSTLVSLTCVDFLKTQALSFTSLDAAIAYFDKLVTDAQKRLSDAEAAVADAQKAVSDAQSAVADAKAAVKTEQAGFVPPQWQDSTCHRSANAAPALAALQIENADPHTSVTFVHVACSGAQIPDLKKQFKKAEGLIGNREIDAVLVSIGGNDVGFSKLAMGCVFQQPCYSDNPYIQKSEYLDFCSVLSLIPNGIGTACTDFFTNSVPKRSAKLVLDSGLAHLPGRYANLDTASAYLPSLQGLLRPDSGAATADPAQLVRNNRVYITEYPNLVMNDSAAYCTTKPDPQDPLGTLVGVTLSEAQWLDRTADVELNSAMQTAATTYGWNYVTGIYEGYTKHGYCAHDHWVNRLDESYLRQGDMNGTAHPNRSGQQFSAGQIVQALLRDFYPNGTDASPRLPDPSRAAGD